MKSSKIILAVAAVGVVAGAATLLQADTRSVIEVEGACHKSLKASKQKVEVESVDLNKLFSAGLATAQRALAKTAELFETSPKKEVSANLSVTVRDEGSETPETEVAVPLKFSIPKLTDADMDAFAEAVMGDTSEYENLIKTRTSLGITEAEFEKQYKACMEDALKDAKAKAEREAASRGVKLGDMISAKAGEADVSTASEESAEINLRLTINASFSTL